MATFFLRRNFADTLNGSFQGIGIQMRFIVLLSFFLICPGTWFKLQAQEVSVIQTEKKNIKISYWQKEQGLPNRYIIDMARAPGGQVWVGGTKTGLISLDGKNFKKHWVAKDSLYSETIHRTLVDARHNIWLFSQTPGGKLYIQIYDPYQEKTYSLEAYTGAALTFSNLVAAQLFEANGRIWMLDISSGIGGYFGPDSRWHETMRCTPHETPDNALYFPAPDNRYWSLNYGTGALDLLQSDGSLITHYPFPSNLLIIDYKMGMDGNLYLIGTPPQQQETVPRVLRCDPLMGIVPLSDEDGVRSEGFTLRKYANGKVSMIWSNNRTGVSLLLNAKGQLNLYDHQQLLYAGLEKYLQQKSIKYLSPWIFTLNDGTFWMTSANALVRIEVTDNFFTPFFQDIALPPSTRSMKVFRDHLLVNSYVGLFDINLKNKKSRLVEEYFGCGLDIYGTSLWSSTYGLRLFSLDLLTKKSAFHPQTYLGGTEFGEVYTSSDGAVYAGANNTVLYKASSESDFHPLHKVSGITFHRNSAGLWIGGHDGIWLLDASNQPIKHFTKEIACKGHMPAVINHIHEDTSGTFWMATDDGLWRWKPFSNEVQAYTAESRGLNTNTLYAIYEDHHERLWIPSQDGLLCYDKNTNKFRTYTTKDGLPGNEFNRFSHCQDAAGRLFFGGIFGVVSFHPDSLARLPDPGFNIHLLSLKISTNYPSDSLQELTREVVFGSGPLHIPYGTDELKIKYCVPDFLREQIQYRWRIPAIDSNWHYLNSAEFSVFNLAYGFYMIELSAIVSGNDFLQSNCLKIPIWVEPPFYFKAWFIVLAILAILGLTLLWSNWRQHRLLQLNRHLAAEVAQKTAQLQQEWDVTAQQKETLQRLNKEKNLFFQELSHEFRNPLSLIIGPTNDLMKHEAMPASFRPQLEQVRRNAQKIMRLIDELLELSKLEAGVVPVYLEPVPLAIFLQRICNDFENLATQKQISLQLTHTISDDFVVITDGRKLEKILINLIQNALKYTLSEGSVHIKAQWLSPGILDVWISDTGIGIAPEHLDQVFERYYQGPIGRGQTSKSGFGIGLSLCRHYTALLGGNISVCSQPGVGTDMHVTIPCKEVTDYTSPEHQQPVATAQTPEQQHQKRLLLVDDQAEMLEYISGILSPMYQIVKSGSGEEAMEILRWQPVELIISDFMMRGMSGLDLLTHVRQKPSLQHIPFVLLTGLEASHFEEEARQQQVNGIFNKPIDESRFLADIQQLLQPHR